MELPPPAADVEARAGLGGRLRAGGQAIGLPPSSALEFGKRVLEAGFPPGVFNVVIGRGPAVGQALVAHPGVDHIAFTGSTAVGKAVARDAAANLTRTSLELGGKSAQLVFDDADLEAVANGVITGIFAATGQTCIAGSRLLVHESRHDKLVERLRERVATIVLGDPLDPETEMGPLANAAQLARSPGSSSGRSSRGDGRLRR